MAKKTKGGKFSIPVEPALDPITNLPVEETAPQNLIDPSVTSSQELYNQVGANETNPGQYQNQRMSELNYYGMDDVTWDVYNTGNIDKMRNANQGKVQMAGSMLGKLIGAEIIGGTVEALGSLVDYPLKWMGVESDEYGQDYENAVTRLGGWVREEITDYLPIHKRNPKANLDMGDPAFWWDGAVTIGSTFSLLLPAAGIMRGATMVGKAAKGFAGAQAVRGTGKVADMFKKAENFLTLGPKQKFLAKATTMGVAMRHMENFREANETYKVALEKNLDFLKKGNNFADFLNSPDGVKYQDEFGGNPGPLAAANYLAGNAAGLAYRNNWGNIVFDIAQSALIIKGPRLFGTRGTGTASHGKKVRDAHYASLKGGDTRSMAKKAYQNYIRPTAKWAAWSYSEGVEEQWNYISMQEGIRKGDIMAGNVGWENTDFKGTLSAMQRGDRYFDEPELWSSTIFGAMGGGVFTSISNLKNRKAQKALNDAQVSEIAKRAEFIQEAKVKKDEALERGDINGAKEQDRLLAMNLGLNAAAAGNVELLLEMLKDPAYAEKLEAAGVTKENIESNKNALIETILKVEKTYQKYSQHLAGKKWGPGAVAALTQLETLVNTYDGLAKDVAAQLQEEENSDAYTREQLNTGPNTQARYEALLTRKMLEGNISSYTKIRDRALEQMGDKSLTEKERKDAEKVFKLAETSLEAFKVGLDTTEKEEATLKADSESTYDTKDLEKENKFLTSINTGGPEGLRMKEEMFKANRDSAWQSMQDILNGLSIKTKDKDGNITDTEFSTSKEADNSTLRDKAVVDNQEEIAESALNRAIMEDFKTLLQTNPNITEDQVRTFFEQYPDNEYIQDIGRTALEQFVQANVNNTMHTSVEQLLAEGVVREEVQSAVEKRIEEFKKEIFDPKISRKEAARRAKIEQEYRELGAAGARKLYGDNTSVDLIVEDIFDNYTKVIPVVWNQMTGAIYRDEQTNELIFRDGQTNKEYIIQETIEGKAFQDSQGNPVKSATLGYLDMLMLNSSNTSIEIIDGRTLNIDGEYYNNLASDPTSAIEYDKQDNVVSVTLAKWDGTKMTFTAPALTYELANVIETLEAVKISRFTDLVQDDFLVIDHNNNEYIVAYETRGFHRLVAKDIDGKPLTGVLNETVLRKANIELSNAIQNEINNLKTEYNETVTTPGNAPNPVTEANLMSPSMGAPESVESAEEQQNAEVSAANTTSNPVPRGNQTVKEEETQTILLENQEAKVERNEQLEIAFEEPKVSPEELEARDGQIAIIESTVNTETGLTREEETSTVLTKNTPTTASASVLNRTYPRGWTAQFLAVPEKDSRIAPKGFLTVRDANGNLIPKYLNPSGNAYTIKNAKDLTESENRLLEQGSERIKTLHYFIPQVNKDNQTINEGDRVVESSMLSQYKVDGQYQVLVVNENSVKVSDVYRTDLTNSPEVGIGTKVVLRVEPINPYSTSTEPIITVRLASNTDIILSDLVMKGLQNEKLRARINKILIDGSTTDIRATIAGKTNGFVINQKTNNGESLKQSISILGKDLNLGIHQGEQGIVYNNTDIPSHRSSYSENGFVYAGITSASGRMVPVRLSTSTLSEQAIQTILNTLTNDNITARDKQSIVNQIVHIPLGLRKDDQFKLGGKMSKILAMDNFVIKIPFQNKVIGIQYNMEGSEKFKRNNLLNALENREFFFKEYDMEGNLVSGMGPIIGTAGNATQNNSLLSSSTLNLKPGELKLAIEEHLASKVYHVEKNKINTKDSYFSPIRQEAYTNYLDYLSTEGIITTDLPGQGEQQFHHAGIYVDVPAKLTKASQAEVPSFVGAVEVEGMVIPETELDVLMTGPVPTTTAGTMTVTTPLTAETYVKGTAGEQVIVEIDPVETVTYKGTKYSVNFNVGSGTITNLKTGKVLEGGVTSPVGQAVVDLAIAQQDSTQQSSEVSDGTIEEIDPNKIDDQFKLREYENLEGNTALITETEEQWFLSRFGQEGLTVMDRLKYMTLKDGRQAYGYYHKGMVTIAKEAQEGTLYWEAFRRIYDLHLLPEEKSAIELEVIQSFNESGEDAIQTRLANEFMKFKLNENAKGLGAKLKKFFKELMYYIKNMMGMKNEIQRLFRDLNTREFTKYTKEEAEALSQAQVPQLREKKGFTTPQVQEIIGGINFKLVEILKANYGDNWTNELVKGKVIKNTYEAVRQDIARKAIEIKELETKSENLRILGNTYSIVSEPSIWYDKPDQYGNIVSPGFITLATKGLENLGIKYKIKQNGSIDFNKAEEVVEEIGSEEVVITDPEVVESETQQHIHNVNFYNTPIKETLSRDVKILLSFIPTTKKGNVFGNYMFHPFDEVYSYLSVALANTASGNVVEKLSTLAETGAHPLIKEVVEVYTKATKQQQNKFASHFNKQNIEFLTLVIQDGVGKVIRTNRNDLTKQVITKWVDGRTNTELFLPATGTTDLINTEAVTKLAELYQETQRLSRLNDKGKYLRAFKSTLDYAGMKLGDNAYKALFEDDTMQIEDLHSYMVGSRSFEYILKGLQKKIPSSPYLPGSETSSLRRIASLSAKFSIDHYTGSFLGANKKPIYAINLNTYDSKITLQLRSDETSEQVIQDRFRDKFYSPAPGMRHLILDMLSTNPEMRLNFRLSTFDAIKEDAYGGRATVYDNMSQELSAQTRVAMYFNSGLAFGHFNTGTKGDKSQSKYIQLPKISPDGRFSSRLWKSGNDRSYTGWVNTAVKLLEPAVYGELARIARTNKQLFGNNPIPVDEQVQNVHYQNKKGDNQGNGLRFVAFPLLNSPQYNFINPSGKLNQVFENLSSMSTIESQRIAIGDALTRYVKDNLTATLTALESSGVIKKTTNGYGNVSLPTSIIDGKVLQGDITPALVEFAVNDLVYKPYINTTFGPDLAYYKTDSTGNPIIDAGKRAYQSVTPGTDAVWNEEKQYGLPNTFTHAILNDIFKDSQEYITNLLTDVGVTPKDTKRIANAYRKINATDAQGFTTLEFHKKEMESDGSWLEEHDEAYKKYWSKGLMGDRASRELLLDPRKTYYYGERVTIDSQGNESITWEQIKHSTIPLLREFTELYKETPAENKITLNELRIRMENKSNPIDMVNFISALKIGSSGVFDYTEDLNTIKVNTLLSQHLRSPQVIKTKVGTTLDGTQKAKLLLLNILDNTKYNVFNSSIDGKDMKDLYNDLYAERIKRSHDKLVAELGINDYNDALDNRVEIGEEQFAKEELKFLQKTRDVIIESLDSRSLPDNYYLALNIEELVNDINAYGFAAPLAFPPFAKRFESILLSLFKNRILKQRFNGMSAVQVAEFGFNTDKTLEIKKHEKGGIYAEVALPYEIAVKLGLKPGDILENSDVYDLIGYRIPTQGKNSMLSLRITRVLPENMGGIILFPAEITTIMGSDFDVDKMYLMFPELSKDNTKISAFSLERYKESKSFEGLSDEAISNAIFDIGNTILTSKDHVKEILDPLDSPTYSKKLAQYEQLGFIEDMSGMNINSFAADLYLEKINKEGGRLIGLFSLQATGHAMAQQMGLSIKEGYSINIAAAGKKYHTTLSNILGFDGQYISTYLSEDQNESLDNAKYQRIGRVGVSVYNSGVVALLNRAGFNNSATLDFINQPVLRDFFRIRDISGPEIQDITIAKDLVSRMGTALEFDSMHYRNEVMFTPTANSLGESLVADYTAKESAIEQTQILSDFLLYNKVGRDLSKFNMAVSPETLKNTSRLSYFERYNNAVNSLSENTSTLNIENSTSRLEAFREYGLDAAVEYTSNFIPYNVPGFLELKKRIANITGQRDGVLTPELTDVINGMALYFSFTKKQSPFGSMIYEKNEVVQKYLFTAESSLLKALTRIKEQYGLTNDPFLGMLYGHESNVSVDNVLQTIAFNNTTRLGTAQLNLITDRWSELLQDPRDEVRVLAENLVKYSVLTSGFMLTPNSFVDLIPISYWQSSGLTEYFRKEARSMGYENYFDDNAVEQIIRNMSTEPGLLMNIDSQKVDTGEALRKSLGLGKNQYFLHKNTAPQLMVNSLEPGVQQYVGYFKSFMEGDLQNKFRIFKYIRSVNNGAVYQEISALGTRFRHVEMQADNIEVESMDPSNTVINPEPVTPSSGRTITDIVDESTTSETNGGLMPRLTPNVKTAVLNSLDLKIETWLMENFNIPVEKVNNLKQKLGVDAVGVADMINKVVTVDTQRDRYTLPEEAGHFYIEMMDNAPMQRLLNLVTATQTYQDVLMEYKDIYTSELDFQKEAAGKILGKYIVGAYTNEVAKEDYGAGLMGTLRKVWDSIKRFFNRVGIKESLNDLNSELYDVLGPAATAIIDNVNPGGLSLENIGVHKYYALQNSKIEFRDADGNVVNMGDKATSMFRRIGRYASSKIPYLKTFTQEQALNELIAESKQIVAPTATNNYYMQDGVKLNRVSNLMEIFQDPFEQQEMAEKVAMKNKREGDPFDTADKVQNLWDFLRDDMGTGLHNLMQGIIEKRDLSELLNSVPENQQTAFKSAIPQLREWVKGREEAGSKLYSEVLIADKSDLLAGTADIIELTSDGRKIIWDLKTKARGKFATIEQKLPNFKGVLSGITNTIFNKYRLQLSMYKNMIEDKGIIIDQLNILPLEADVSVDAQGNITFSKVAFAEGGLQVLNKLNNLEPIKPKLLKQMISYVSPETDEAGATQQKDSDKLLAIFEKSKDQIAKKIIKYKKSTGKTEYLSAIETLHQELEELTEKEGLILYTKRAVRDINSAYKKLKSLQQSGSLNPKNLGQILDFVSVYDILDDITLMAPILSNSGYKNLLEKYAQPAIAKRELVKSEHAALIRPMVAETLGKLSKNPDMSVEELEKQLTLASTDTSFASRWMDGLGDSTDTTLAMVSKIISLQRIKVREATTDLKYGTKTTVGLMKVMKALEKYQHSQGISLFSSREVYDFMLETTKEGKLTGALVNPHTPEFRMLQDKFIQDNTHLDALNWNAFYAEHNPNDYLSPKYKAITEMSKDDPRKQFFEFYKENYLYAQSLLPKNQQKKLQLPSLRASAGERIMEKEGGIITRSYDAVKESISEMMVRQVDNVSYGEYTDESGNPLDYVPVHYVRTIGNEDGQLSPEDVAYDLGAGLQRFYTMATNYYHMNEIMPELEGTLETVKNREVMKRVAGMPQIDPVTNKPQTMQGMDSNSFNRLKDAFQAQVYGKRKKKGASVNIGGKTINSDQIWDALLQYGSLRVLAMNKHAALSNVTFGSFMNAIEGFANEHYSLKNYTKAKSLYTAGMIGMTQDLLARAPESKIGLLNEYFDVLQEFDEYGNPMGNRQMALRGNTGALYFLMSSGEHMIQTQMGLALMLNTKFQTSKGEVNLYDAYTVVNGRLELDPEVEAQFGQVQRAEFTEKMHAVYQRIHGIYNEKDKSALQQYTAGRWAMQFRKWARPGYLRRFQGIEKLFYDKESDLKKLDFNERLQTEVEGNYITTIRFFERVRQDLFKLQFLTSPARYKELSSHQQANLRRSLGESIGLVVLFVLGGLFEGDDDEPRNAFQNQMLYNVKRVQSEFLFYNPLGSSFYEILRTPAANLTSIEAYGKLGAQLVSDMTSILTGGDFERYKRKSGKFEKGDAKLGKYWRNVLIGKEFFSDPKDKLKFFDLQ
tara:strand:- start:19253 stop:36049 length:16797 start_codon:yes stop_codon:yes gene_type:complete